jgi:hypothetical protein
MQMQVGAHGQVSYKPKLNQPATRKTAQHPGQWLFKTHCIPAIPDFSAMMLTASWGSEFLPVNVRSRDFGVPSER